jgi:hypothetical protein
MSGATPNAELEEKRAEEPQRDLLVVIPDSSISIHSIRTTRKKNHIDFTY